MDSATLREKYRQERDKRLRADGNQQYRRLAGSEPDGVAVDRRGRFVEALRLQSLTGGAPGARVVSGLRAPTRLSDRRLAR